VTEARALGPRGVRSVAPSPNSATWDNALRLGCAAIGFTLYPGSSLSLEMFEDIAEMRREMAAKGMATMT
jgi:DhnA family fructose-bisphosphate aldolase class Ia